MCWHYVEHIGTEAGGEVPFIVKTFMYRKKNTLGVTTL